VLNGLGPHMPDGWQDDMATIQAPVDWVGINYYTRKLIAPAPGPWPALQEVDGPLPKTQMGWEIYPDGLEFFLRRTAAEYSGNLPIYITENGMANPDILVGEKVDDTARIAFLAQHLGAVQRAMNDGVPVGGYFTWSLLDNYEWSLGYEKRFGLVHVDFETLRRTPKASYHALKAALSQRS
jgi:beta-glucosidase